MSEEELQYLTGLLGFSSHSASALLIDRHEWLISCLSVHILDATAIVHTEPNLVITNRISEGGNAIASIRLSVRLFVFTLSLESTDR